MKSWSVRQRILTSFTVIIVMMIAMGAFSYLRLQEIEEQTALVQGNTLPVLHDTAQVFVSWQENYSLTQKIVIQIDKSAYDKVNGDLQTNRARLDEHLRKLLATGIDKQLIDILMSLKDPYEGLQSRIVAISATLRDTATDPAASLQRSAA